MANYYVPVLKWKRGEQKAIELLDNVSKNNLLPLLEIPPIDWDWINNRPKKTIDSHIIDIEKTIKNSFGINPVFLDISQIENENLLASGKHSIEEIVSKSVNENLNLIPVVRFKMRSDYKNAIKKLLDNSLISSLCIRIYENDFPNLNIDLKSLLNFFDINESNCHIVIDLQEVAQSSYTKYSSKIPKIINSLVNLNKWSTITISSTSFPETLSEVSKNSYKVLPRIEFNLWIDISKHSNRLIQFGDYCISNPKYSDIDPRYMGMSGNIRYTISNGFLVYKGINAKKHGFSQMISLCSQLIQSGYYLGSSFSWGDKYIEDCSIRVASTGNAETWRRVGTNHHIKFTTSQLSNHSYF